MQPYSSLNPSSYSWYFSTISVHFSPNLSNLQINISFFVYYMSNIIDTDIRNQSLLVSTQERLRSVCTYVQANLSLSWEPKTWSRAHMLWQSRHLTKQIYRLIWVLTLHSESYLSHCLDSLFQLFKYLKSQISWLEYVQDSAHNLLVCKRIWPLVKQESTLEGKIWLLGRKLDSFLLAWSKQEAEKVVSLWKLIKNLPLCILYILLKQQGSSGP